MSLHLVIDSGLVLILLLVLAILSAGRLATCIRIFATQCVVLAFLPLLSQLAHGEAVTHHALIMLLGTMALKVLLIPWVLIRTI